MQDRMLVDYKTIFWDFDGVIKDAVAVKTQTYEKLFESYGPLVQSKVVRHHKLHGGMSRLVKIPLYYKEYVGVELSKTDLEKALQLFSEISFEAVLKSPWVPGVITYLQKYAKKQNFYIVTGTPQGEIEQICECLGIEKLFQGIYGAPRKKADCIAETMNKHQFNPRHTAMIGDAFGDYQAASMNQIDFFWRENEPVRHLFDNIECYRIHDFLMVD